MAIQISQDALDLLFRILLSCRCPVSDKEERAIFEKLLRARDGEKIDYRELLRIFLSDEPTVFHRLLDFCIWQGSIHTDFFIEREHILRHFASSYHWQFVVANDLPASYKNILHLPQWFIGHMLVPMQITGRGGTANGKYIYPGGEIIFKNLFFPPDIAVSSQYYAVHLASVCSPLSDPEVSLVRRLIEENPVFVKYREKCKEVDYCDFQLFGDYQSLCRKRYAQYN
ncbi:MAG: hypothetical protein PHI63_01255 [Patescibacteria group bacterium]|nr:hypothetical protein [Patescibacteria group bacterium]